MAIYDCKVNHLENPLGFDLGKPVFTWKGGNGRLLIARDAALRDLVYDSGEEIFDPLCAQPDLELAPRTRYFWRVADGPVNWFETAKLDEPWQAKWIGCDRTEARHPIFSKKIDVRGQVASARLYLCGLGLYEARIDGAKVGDEYLTPFCNDYHEWVQYQTYDVTDALKNGGALAVELGNGWYSGRFGFVSRPGQAGFYGDDWKLLAEIRLRYADGSEDVIGTDGSWTVTRGHVTFSNIYDGEHVNMTLPETAPVPASLAEAPKAPLRARLSPPVKVWRELPVKEVLHTPAGETVFDIGQNMTGIFRLCVHISEGETLHLQFGEHMQDGNFYRDNLRTAKAEYFWTSDGAEHIIEPRFTFYGYRYVKVEGADIAPEDFTALVVHSYIPQIGTLTTGHALVNRLIENVMWGQRGNYLDVPTDCPQRDERMGWTGDAQVFAPTASYFTDCAAFLHKYLTDMNMEQAKRGGMVPITVPAFGLESAATAWGDAATVIPWTVYTFTGDRALLEAHFEGMAAWTDYCAKEYDNGTWLTQFHYGDWVALDGPRAADAVRGGTDEAFIASAYLIRSARLTANAARVLGRGEDAERFDDLAGRVRDDLIREYYSPTGRCCVNTQTAHLLTLAFDLHPNREKAEAGLRERLQWSNGKLQTGFVGTPLLCPTLSELGMVQEAYDLLLNEDLPGWLYEVKMGATTVWERWNSVDPDGHMSSTGMNSLNHYAYGSIAEWIWRWCAGLEPVEPGFRRVKLHPVPDRRLGRLDAAYDSASGLYEVHWQCPDLSHVTLSVTVPEGGEAELTLPWAPESAYTAGHVLKGGTYEFTYETTRPMTRGLSVDMSVWQILSDIEGGKALRELIPGIDSVEGSLLTLSFKELSARFGKPELADTVAKALSVI